MDVSLADHDRNFSDLAGVAFHCIGMSAKQLREHILAVEEITTSNGFYGPHAAAAEVVKNTALGALRRMLDDTIVREKTYAEKRARWQAKLDEFRQALAVAPEDEVPENGPAILHALESLSSAGVSEEMYGDLQPEAERLRQEGVLNYQHVLARISLKVLDPAHIPDTYDGPSCMLEHEVKAFADMPVSLEAFNGDVAMFERAKDLHAQSVRKHAELLEKTRERERKEIEGKVVSAIERRDECGRCHKLEDAYMTPEQKTARLQRAIEAAEPLFLLVRRLTEIVVVDDQNHTGLIDAMGLKECAEQAQALVLRVEGRLN